VSTARPRPIEIGELAAQLNARTAELAPEVLPQGRRERDEWVVAGKHSPFGCSLGVRLSGAKAGVWCAWAADKSGDALDLVAAVKFDGDKRKAICWTRDWLRLDLPQAASPNGSAPPAGQQLLTAISEKHEPDAARDAAFRLWLAASPLRPGDEAYDYLETRGIDFATMGRVPRALRYVRALTNTEAGRRFPALVAAVMGPRGRFLAVHRTWLERQSDGRVTKAPVATAKKVYGPCRGGLVPLWRGASGQPWRKAPPGDTLGLAEGIENALSYALAVPEHRVAAALNVGNLAHIRLPPAITTVIIAADGDAPNSPAQRLLERAAAHFLAQGRQVKIARCPTGVKDLNDLLLSGNVG
jgi:hypothetical protein